MPGRAHVASVDAIADFRARFVVFLGKARSLLDESCADVRGLRAWLQSDRRPHWEGELRRRTRKLDEARQALFSSGLSGLREPAAAERGAVARAQHEVREAEARLQAVRRWVREFDDRADPLVKELESLGTVLGVDMARGVAWLDQAVRTLDAYAGVAPPPPGPGPAPDRPEGGP
jgi:hypothetical protein